MFNKCRAIVFFIEIIKSYSWNQTVALQKPMITWNVNICGTNNMLLVHNCVMLKNMQ